MKDPALTRLGEIEATLLMLAARRQRLEQCVTMARADALTTWARTSLTAAEREASDMFRDLDDLARQVDQFRTVLEQQRSSAP